MIEPTKTQCHLRHIDAGRAQSQPNDGINTFVGKIYVREINGLSAWRATHPGTELSIKSVCGAVDAVERLLRLVCNSKIDELTHQL